mmetsp:Transcript_5415/g.15787  ORF Transcript_5415/g.15787 Transcript_5415/m.15787 type:complete len:221 (+) Transcript_5415:625-1287(+)
MTSTSRSKCIVGYGDRIVKSPASSSPAWAAYVLCVASGWNSTICRSDSKPRACMESDWRRQDACTRVRKVDISGKSAVSRTRRVVSGRRRRSEDPVASHSPNFPTISPASAVNSSTSTSSFDAFDATMRSLWGSERTGGAKGHSLWPITTSSSHFRVARMSRSAFLLRDLADETAENSRRCDASEGINARMCIVGSCLDARNRDAIVVFGPWLASGSCPC